MAVELGIDLSDPESARFLLRTASFRSSPYPDTQTVREWEEIHPGAAKAFIEMPLNQAKHRQSMERIANFGEVAAKLLGVLLAGAVALGSVYGAITLGSSANKQGTDYLIILVLLIVGVGGTNIIPGLIEKIPRFKFTRDDS